MLCYTDADGVTGVNHSGWSSMTMGSYRRKRFVRDSRQPPEMRLTPRDVQVLRAVHAFRLLTTAQIGRLLFSPTTTSICARRLRLLFHHGYLARFPAPVR